MSELSDLWAEYYAIEQSGSTISKRAKEIEAKIHALQKSMSAGRYDFNKRRERIEAEKVSTVSGPPDANEKPEKEEAPQGHFTFAEARKLIDDNDFNLLEDCAKNYEIKAILLADILMKMNPENRTNFARRGQGINWALTEFYRNKDKK